MASAISGSKSKSQSSDSSIQAQDSEVLQNSEKQTQIALLGGTTIANTYSAGENAILNVVPDKAFEVVEAIGKGAFEFVETVGDKFINGVLGATSSLLSSNQVLNEETALTSQKNVISLFKVAAVGVAFVGVVYFLTKK